MTDGRVSPLALADDRQYGTFEAKGLANFRIADHTNWKS
jgi:hypothetical protein